MGLSSHDFVQIYNKGVSINTIENHLNVLETEFLKLF